MNINFGAVPKALNANRSNNFLSGLIHNPYSDEARRDRKWEQRLAVSTQVQEDKELRRHQRQKDIVDYRHNSRIKHNRIENSIRRVEKRNEAQDAADIKLKLHTDMGDVDVANHGRRNKQDVKAAKKISRAKEVGRAQGKVTGEQLMLNAQQQMQPQRHALDDADLQHKLDNAEIAHLHSEDLKDKAGDAARVRKGQDFQQKLTQTKAFDQQKVRATKSGARARIVGQAEGERRALQITQQIQPMRHSVEDQQLTHELSQAAQRDQALEDRKNIRATGEIQRKQASTRSDIQNHWDQIHSGLKTPKPGGQMPDWYTPPKGTAWDPPAPPAPTRQSNVTQTTPPTPTPQQPAQTPPAGSTSGNGSAAPKTPKPRTKKQQAGSGNGSATPTPQQPTQTPSPDPHASGNGSAPTPAAPEPTVNQGKPSAPEATVDPHATGNGTSPKRASSRRQASVQVQPNMGLSVAKGNPIKQRAAAWGKPRPATRALLKPGEIPHEKHEPTAHAAYMKRVPDLRRINETERDANQTVRASVKAGTHNSEQAWNDILAQHAQANTKAKKPNG